MSCAKPVPRAGSTPQDIQGQAKAMRAGQPSTGAYPHHANSGTRSAKRAQQSSQLMQQTAPAQRARRDALQRLVHALAAEDMAAGRLHGLLKVVVADWALCV